MNRYDNNFEQCEDGEWVKHSEVSYMSIYLHGTELACVVFLAIALVELCLLIGIIVSQ
jgi:hypothetical protein